MKKGFFSELPLWSSPARVLLESTLGFTAKSAKGAKELSRACVLDGGKCEQGNRLELEEFLDSPRVRLYGIDEDTAEFYADILNRLRKKGKPIPTNDIWSASVALQHGLQFYTSYRHFKNIPGLIRITKYPSGGE